MSSSLPSLAAGQLHAKLHTLLPFPNGVKSQIQELILLYDSSEPGTYFF